MTKENDIVDQLGQYASRLGERVNITDTSEIRNRHTEPQSRTSDDSSGRRLSRTAMKRIPIGVAAGIVIIGLIGVAIALTLSSGNLPNESDTEIAATADSHKGNEAKNDDAQSSSKPHDSAIGAMGGAIAQVSSRADLTNPIEVIIRGQLVRDMRGHEEICASGSGFNHQSSTPRCAGIAIVGADDHSVLEQIIAKRDDHSATNGAHSTVVAQGTIGQEGLWVSDVEVDSSPYEWLLGSLSADCQGQNCTNDLMTATTVISDALNDAVQSKPGFSIISMQIGYSPEVSSSTGPLIVAIQTASTDAEITNLIKTTVAQVSPVLVEVHIESWIEVQGNRTIDALPRLYGSTAPLLTSNAPSHGSMMALLSGTLTFDPTTKCSGIRTGSGEFIHVMWPFGYSASAADGTIIDFDGHVVARHGDDVGLGGGHVPYVAAGTNESGTGDDTYQAVCGDFEQVFVTGGLAPN